MKAKLDYGDLKKFRDNLASLNEARVQEFTEAALKDLAARLLRKVMKRTPVGKNLGRGKMNETVTVSGGKGEKRRFLTRRAAALQAVWDGYQGGTLRRGWTVGEVTKKGSEYSIEIVNPVEYAYYVEYGHRGVFIPELGKTMHIGTKWTPGHWILTVSEQELKRDAPKILQNRLNKFVKEVLNVK